MFSRPPAHEIPDTPGWRKRNAPQGEDERTRGAHHRRNHEDNDLTNYRTANPQPVVRSR